MLSLRIALRYLIARKSHRAVNVIALIAMGGVAVAVTAMIMVLSIYNGFEELARERLSRLDPELLVERADGRVITNADSLASVLASQRGVAAAMPTLTERALMVSGQAQMPVVFKGIPDGFSEGVTDIDSILVDGTYATETSTGYAAAQISVGVSNSMGLRPDAVPVAHLYVPRRVGRINPANPAAAFAEGTVMVSGVFQIDEAQVDADHIIIPLEEARALLDYTTEAGAVELRLEPGTSLSDMKETLRHRMGDDYLVRDRMEQRQESFRMISIEKWVTFMMLIFVLVIALFNIVSTLSLLIIEKRDNMSTLRAMGATQRSTGNIFAAEGMLITLCGGAIGTVLGVGLSLAQQFGHFIKLGGAEGSTIVDAYPVRVDVTDLLAVAAAVVVMGLLMGAVSRLLVRRALS